MRRPGEFRWITPDALLADCGERSVARQRALQPLAHRFQLGKHSLDGAGHPGHRSHHRRHPRGKLPRQAFGLGAHHLAQRRVGIDFAPGLAAARPYRREVDELEASLTYAMQNGLEVSVWGRNLLDEDVVLWYVFGSHHFPRLEDWPVMPVVSCGFHLRPVGFFDYNPALDVPPPPPAGCHDT